MIDQKTTLFALCGAFGDVGSVTDDLDKAIALFKTLGGVSSDAYHRDDENLFIIIRDKRGEVIGTVRRVRWLG